MDHLPEAGTTRTSLFSFPCAVSSSPGRRIDSVPKAAMPSPVERKAHTG